MINTRAHALPAARAIAPAVSHVPAFAGTFSPDEILTRAQLAERLKMTVSGVRKLSERRVIPTIKMGRRCVRYRWRDVEAALQKLTVREVCP